MVSDYIEQISHSICTHELYKVFLDQIYNETKVRPRQYEFARLNLIIPVSESYYSWCRKTWSMDGMIHVCLLFLD
jgi:hypothetical protein